MALPFKTPGVRIVEVQSPGPIEGVGTSTAAFVGPALDGDFYKPTKVVNWTQFCNKFGIEIEGEPQKLKNPYNATPRIFMPHAVRGFFDNGGTVCYIVRVGTGAKATLRLEDRNGGTPATHALEVTAKREGTNGNNIQVKVEDAHKASTKAVRCDTSITIASGITATVGDATKFRVGDQVLLTEGPTKKDTVVISKIQGNVLTFETSLANIYTNAGKIRLADFEVGKRFIRVEDAGEIEIGSVIKIEQTGGNSEEILVLGVSAAVQPPGQPRPGVLTLPSAGIAKKYTMAATDADVTVVTQEFKLTVTRGGKEEPFDNLSMEPSHSRYFARVVNSTLVSVALPSTPSPAIPPKNQPKVINNLTNLAGGVDDDLSKLSATHYQQGIAELENIDDVNILCIPDRTDPNVQNEMIAHCQNMQDRFAILDPGPTPNVDPLSAGGILFQRNSLAGNPRGFAALYYPRLIISNPDPLVGGSLTIPPCGHIAGIYARSDASRGVHKAPANEPIQGVLGLEHVLNDEEQGELNEKQVNVLRIFRGMGPTVWGARTISTETAWRYVSTRRLFLFLEESIQEGTRFAVFEPNDLALWSKIKRVVTGFLTRVWRSGALFGATPEEAFFVKVDEELNPPDVRALGQVIIEVGVLPAFPAEFVIFRIGQKAGGAEVMELG